MVCIELGVEDLANTRFGISPLTETVFSLWAVTDPSRHTLHLPWLRTVRGRLESKDSGLLHALVGPTRLPPDFRGNPSRTLPDFLTPRPTKFIVRFEDELASVRATPPDVVRRDLVATHAPDRVPQVLRGGTRSDKRATLQLLGAICDALDRHWERSVAPSWPEMRLILEADTTYRARQLASGGAHLLFADLHPNVQWRDGVLTVAEMMSDHTTSAAGRGLLLIPSIFAYKPVPPLGADEPPSLGYPSRGIATLWAPPPQAQTGALVDLLGRTRALLLEMLDEPLSTAEVARRLRVTPSAVSQHFRVLRSTGLLTCDRDRRQVLYRRTPIAAQLMRRDTDARE